MTLQQLRYLVALAKERNFTRAAGECNVAQPAFSRQIRTLESEVGVPLVDRTTRRVAMTAAGLEFAGRAEGILLDLDDARQSIVRRLTLEVGRVDVGMTSTPGPFDAAASLGEFQRRYPGIEMALREDLSLRLVDSLRRDELDIAIVSGVSPADRTALTLELLAAEPLEALVPLDHPLAQRKVVSLAELSGERFVSFPQGATIRAAVDEVAEAGGFPVRVAFEASHASRVRDLVHHGLGVAILPTSDAAAPGPEVVRLRMRERSLRHEVYVAWRTARRLAPAAAALLMQIRTGRSTAAA